MASTTGTSTRKTTRKPRTTRATASKSSTTKSTTAKSSKSSARSATKSAPKVATKANAGADLPQLKKREFIDLVAEQSEVKRKSAKAVTEAMLGILGEAIANGQELSLPPMGKLKINRTKDRDADRIVICKLRRIKRDTAKNANFKPRPKSDVAVAPAPVKAAAPAAPVSAAPKVVTEAVVPVSEVIQGQMRKNELLELVLDRTDVKQKFAKPVIDAVLSILGEAIAKGQDIKLPPMGRVRVNRIMDKDNGQVVICKLRQVKASEATAA